MGRLMSNQLLRGLLVVLLASACSRADLSLTEYVEQTNALAEQAIQEGEAIVADGQGVQEFTPQVLQDGLERGVALRTKLQESVDRIDPPDQIAELHSLLWEWHERFIPIEAALADRAGATEHSESGWTALSDSPEMASYRAAIAEGKQVCDDFQTRLDAAAERGAFDATPWIAGQIEDVGNALLGCAWFPENPNDVYRYPPRS